MKLNAIERGEAQLSDYIEPSTDSRAIREKEKAKRALERRLAKEKRDAQMPAQKEFMAECIAKAEGVCKLARITGIPSGSLSTWSNGRAPLPDDRRKQLETYLRGEATHDDD